MNTCMQVADLELLLGGLRASQFHLQGSAQCSMGPHPAMLVGSEDNAKALARCVHKYMHTFLVCPSEESVVYTAMLPVMLSVETSRN